MANPTETALTNSEAAALSGTTAPGTGAAYCTIGEAEYYTADYRKEAIKNRILALANELRVVKDGDLTCGVWAGKFMDGLAARSYAGAAEQALSDDATNYIYLTVAGVLTINTTGFPSGPHLPLATIATGSESVAGVSGRYDFVDITDYRGRALWQPAGGPRLDSLISQTLAYGDFTDNGDATGYIDFTTGDLPEGAIVLGWKADVTEGFTGDTTATIMVGKSGDTDAYSAETDKSVFAIDIVRSAAQESKAACNATVTPRVTVTGASDFGNISAGAMTVTIYYLDTGA